MYGWTFDQIASMTKIQQLAALGDDEDDGTVDFDGYEEYRRWAATL